LEKYPDRIKWGTLCANESPEAIALLSKHIDRIDWKVLSANKSPEAFTLLSKHIDRIDWSVLSANESPRAIALLTQYPDRIDFGELIYNKNAISLFKQYPEKIEWEMVSECRFICDILLDYDYIAMRDTMQEFTNELIQYVFHPKRLIRICNLYNIEFIDYVEMLFL
jgi:hypothetical protein